MNDKERTLDIFMKRKSIRSYSDEPVEKEKIDIIMEAVRWSPSAQNKQPWEFIIVTDPGKKQETLKHLGFNTNISFLKDAPVLVIGLADKRKNIRLNGIDLYLIDFAIAMEHLVLAAASLGLGTCWMAWFSEKPLAKYLGIPGHLKIVAITPLGYPSDKNSLLGFISSKIVARSSNRKEIPDFVFFNKYGK